MAARQPQPEPHGARAAAPGRFARAADRRSEVQFLPLVGAPEGKAMLLARALSEEAPRHGSSSARPPKAASRCA